MPPLTKARIHLSEQFSANLNSPQYAIEQLQLGAAQHLDVFNCRSAINTPLKGHVALHTADMDQHTDPVGGDQQPSGGLFALIMDRLSVYGSNASNNIADGFSNMTAQNWIRVVILAGGYMLLRPYLSKMVTKGAVAKMESDDKKEREARGEGDDTLPHPELTPNEYRGIKEKLYAEIDTEGDGSGADWGQTARVRQRDMLRNLLEEDERRRAAQNEDADIQEFLED